MTVALLVLGGSGFVGRAVVDEALERGWEVTTFNRGRRPSADTRVRPITGDRLEPAGMDGFASGRWDLVVDTCSGAPRAVLASAELLQDRAERYVYISSGSVYAPPVPLGVTEAERTVFGDAHAEVGDYSELALARQLPGLRSYSVSRTPPTPIRGGGAYHLVAELEWADIDTMRRNFASPLDQELTQDVDGLAELCPGIQSMIYELEPLHDPTHA